MSDDAAARAVKAHLKTQEKAAIQQLFGEDEVVLYDVRKDTNCILTFEGNVVKNLNDAPFQAILMSATHRHRFHRAAAPMIRLMGQFTNQKVMEAVGAECRTLVPRLAWKAFTMFKPVLVCESEAHEADEAYKADKVKRILTKFTEEIAAEDDAVRQQFEQANAVERGEVVVDHYPDYQRSVMDAAAALFASEDDAEAKAALRGGTEGGKRARRRAWRRTAKEAKKQQRAEADGAGATKGKLVPGVHTVNSQMRDLMPNHKVAAVVIVLDNTEDGLDEHVVFVLGTFPSLAEFRSFEARAYPHMGRYRIMDVPMWQWVNLEKRVRDRSAETIYHTKMQKQLYAHRRAAHELAQDEAKRRAGVDRPGLQAISFGTVDMEAEDDEGLFADAEAAWAEYNAAAGASDRPTSPADKAADEVVIEML